MKGIKSIKTIFSKGTLDKSPLSLYKAIGMKANPGIQAPGNIQHPITDFNKRESRKAYNIKINANPRKP